MKTDALTIKATDEEKAKKALVFKGGIGNWRVSKTEEINFPQGMLEMRQNRAVEVEELEFNDLRLTIDDEYDTDKLCQMFEQHKRVMIRAELAGSGKSYACERMRARGHKVIFVCPTNVLAEKYKEHGCTLNKFFGIGLTEESKVTRFDDASYDTIVFDESSSTA